MGCVITQPQKANMKIFVDGSSGATGVVLTDMLNERPYEIITIPDVRDKDARYAAINAADVAVLCLPDDVVFETYNDNHNTDTILIDASSFSRQNPDWVYGYYYDVWTGVADVAHSRRISNPGCFATGIQTLLHPIQPWLTHYPIVIDGVSGYTAGGKQAVERYQSNPCPYKATNINRQHTHVGEVRMRSSLVNDLIFMPAVGAFAEGQLVSIPLSRHQLTMPLDCVYMSIANYYNSNPVVDVWPAPPKSITPDSMMLPGRIQVAVAEFADYVILHAWYSNLDIGAAGSVVRIIDAISEHRKD